MSNLASNDLPINELALLYLEPHHDDLNTPEDYINAFKQLKQMLESHLAKSQPTNSYSAIPSMPMQQSYWHK